MGVLKPTDEWKVGTVKAGDTSFCAMVSKYDNGVGLAFARTTDGFGTVAINLGRGLVKAGEQYDARLMVGGASPRLVKAKGTSDHSVVVQLGKDQTLVDSLNGAATLQIVLPAADLSFALQSFPASYKNLVSCTQTLGPKVAAAHVPYVEQSPIDREVQKLAQSGKPGADADGETGLDAQIDAASSGANSVTAAGTDQKPERKLLASAHSDLPAVPPSDAGAMARHWDNQQSATEAATKAKAPAVVAQAPVLVPITLVPPAQSIASPNKAAKAALVAKVDAKSRENAQENTVRAVAQDSGRVAALESERDTLKQKEAADQQKLAGLEKTLDQRASTIQQLQQQGDGRTAELVKQHRALNDKLDEKTTQVQQLQQQIAAMKTAQQANAASGGAPNAVQKTNTVVETAANIAAAAKSAIGAGVRRSLVIVNDDAAALAQLKAGDRTPHTLSVITPSAGGDTASTGEIHSTGGGAAAAATTANNAELTKARKEIADLRRRNDELSEQVALGSSAPAPSSAEKKALDDQRAALDARRAELDKAQAEVVELRVKNAALSQQLAAAPAISLTAAADRQTLEKQRAELDARRAELDKSQADAAGWHAKTDALTEQLAEARQAAAAPLKSAAADRQALESQRAALDKAQADAAGWHAKTDALTQQLAEAHKAAAEPLKAAAAEHAELGRAQAEVAELRARNAELSERSEAADRAGKDSTATRAALDAQRGELDRARAELADLRSRNAKLSEQVASAEDSVKTAQAGEAAAQQAGKDASATRAALDSQRAELDARRAELDKAKAEAAALRAKNEELSGKLADVQTETERRMAQAEDEIKALRAARAENERKISAVSAPPAAMHVYVPSVPARGLAQLEPAAGGSAPIISAPPTAVPAAAVAAEEPAEAPAASTDNAGYDNNRAAAFLDKIMAYHHAPGGSAVESADAVYALPEYHPPVGAHNAPAHARMAPVEMAQNVPVRSYGSYAAGKPAAAPVASNGGDGVMSSMPVSDVSAEALAPAPVHGGKAAAAAAADGGRIEKLLASSGVDASFKPDGGAALRQWTTGNLNGMYEQLPAGNFQALAQSYIGRYRQDCPGKLSVNMSQPQKTSTGTLQQANISCGIPSNSYSTSFVFVQEQGKFGAILHTGYPEDANKVRTVGDSIAATLESSGGLSGAGESASASRPGLVR
jgi:DNA repair exonuclease SbcCD ATPase subunit